MKKLLTFAMCFMLLNGCKQQADQSEAQTHPEDENTIELTAAQVKNAGIELGKLQQRQISGVVKANGVLDVPPQQLVSISVPLGGFLKSTTLLQGSKVVKGQVIAVIENPDYIQLQQDYLEARNLSEYNKAEYERQQQLAKENVNAQKVLQQAKTSYLNGLARVNGLAARLQLLNINAAALKEESISAAANVYSPIDGFVTAVNVNIGKFVNPADVLFTIVDTEHLHAEVTIFEKDIPKVKIGQKVRFRLSNETSERTATVYLIGHEIKPDRTVNIHCHIDKEDKDLLPGMFLSAVIETGGTLVTALPDEAIVDFQGRKFVFVPADVQHEKTSEENNEQHQAESHFKMIEISAGVSEGGFTEVTVPEAVEVQTDIVTNGGYAILSKMKNAEGVDE
ncbi:MAG TPA: efflux RND transporter periplasmic adaptor subunit [Cyclobacteriaceae bacterium]